LARSSSYATADVGPYWFDPTSMSFVKCYLWTSRPSASGLAASEDTTSTLTFRCTPEIHSGRYAVGSCPTDGIIALPSGFAGEPAFGPSTEAESNPSATSLEVSRPSDDISRRVRITRVCLTRHLPSMAILRPSTVYSSHWIARLVSCERRPWGSKSRDHSTHQPRTLRFQLPGRTRALRTHRPKPES